MDWFDQEDDYIENNNIFENKDYCDNIFQPKLNNFNDFEIRMDDFILDKYSTDTKPSPNQNLKEYKILSSSFKDDKINKFISKNDNKYKTCTKSITSQTQLSSEEKNDSLDKTLLDNDSLFNNNSISNDFIKIHQMSLSERMKYKKERTKKLLEKKTQRESELQELENSSSTQPTHNLNKKEIKMLRNRISAQKSRDRKKKEFEELKFISQNIINENKNLKKQLVEKNKEIDNLKNKLTNLCENCTKLFPINVKRANIVDFQFNQSSNIANKLKYSLMASFIVVVCLIGTFSFSGNASDKNLRILVQENKTISTEIIPYNDDNKSLEVYKPSYPFRITKDLSRKGEIQFLEKKRHEFLMRINNRKSDDDKFLNEVTCPNTESLIWGIHNEKTDSENNSIILRTESESNIINYDYKIIEDDFYKNNIKSMYCKDFLTNVEHNNRIFEDLFKKVNIDSYQKNDEDCYYLHVVVPEEETKSTTDKKIFYEVGCKVFEINKIYK